MFFFYFCFYCVEDRYATAVVVNNDCLTLTHSLTLIIAAGSYPVSSVLLWLLMLFSPHLDKSRGQNTNKKRTMCHDKGFALTCTYTHLT